MHIHNSLVHLHWSNNFISPQMVAEHDKHHKLKEKNTKQYTL